MRRRAFMALVAGAAAGWPLATRAQQPAMPVIGVLHPGSPETSRDFAADFRQGLADAGYVEGRNVGIEYRWAHAQLENLRALADELVARRVNVIFAPGPVGPVRAAKAATSTIPIVFAGGVDPVRYGLVDSLHRPGGNVTGVTFLHGELAAKRLDLMRDLVPDAKTAGYLISDLRNSPITREQTNELVAEARAQGRQVIVLECRSERDFEPAFASLVRGGGGALVVEAFLTAFSNRDKIVALAAQHRIPAIYPQHQYVHGGGLMSYTATTSFREVAFQYVAPILKGARPADMPVQRPTKFSLAINLKTAKALGLEVPPSILVRADRVIE